MKTVESFIAQCQKICRQFEGRDVDYEDMGQLIKRAGDRMSGPIHPMITGIRSLAFDLAEDLPLSNEEKEEKCRILCQAVDDYAKGRWDPTVWCLMVIYTTSDDLDSISESISAKVTRQNDDTVVETSCDELRQAIISTIERVDKNQTDRWYMHNIAYLLPKEYDTFRLMSAVVDEYLVQPRHPLMV